MIASLAWEEASRSQSRSHRRCRHRRWRRPPPRPPPPGPPSRSSTEDYNQTFRRWRRHSPQRSGGKAICPRWTMSFLET